MEKLIKLKEEDIDLLFEKLSVFNKIQDKDYKKEGLNELPYDFLLKTTNLEITNDVPLIDLNVLSFERGNKEKFKELLKDCYMDADDLLFYPFIINRMNYKKTTRLVKDEVKTHLKYTAETGLVKFYHKEYGEWFNKKLEEGWNREGK